MGKSKPDKYKDFDKVRESAEAWYATVSEVHCPYLERKVAFNHKGIAHIKFKRDGIIRHRADQYVRLKHIRYAQRILERSRTLQDYRKGRGVELSKDEHGKYVAIQQVTYHCFIAIVVHESEMKRFKVVVKQVGNGQPYFWSIIPFWSKKWHVQPGNLEED